MITSLAAGTCAVTFLVDPFIEFRSTSPVVYDTIQPKVSEVLAESAIAPNIEIADIGISITDAERPSWYPNEGEQRVLRRALLRSSNVVSRGRLVR